MSWRVMGQYIETCSCNMLCPCYFGVQELMIMDQGWCATALAFRIREGNADGVDLGGRTVVWAPVFPGPTLFDGNATARLYLEDGASADQRRELEAIFQGQKGGPMAALGSALISNWLPTQTTDIAVKEEGETITVTVGNVGEVRSSLLRDPQGLSFELRGGGFVAGMGLESVDLAPSASKWSDPDLRPFETRSGARGIFTWSG
jgi:hypothetical protein